jgi:hypothetical protein
MIRIDGRSLGNGHGLFRYGAFAAARVRRPSIQNIRERYFNDVPRARISGRLTSSRLVSSAAPRLSVSLIHIAQQCGPFATYRPVSPPPSLDDLQMHNDTSNPPVLTLRNSRSVSPGTPLKLPTPENCQSKPTVPMKAALVIW